MFSKILVSPLDPNLKELEALRWTSGHQTFLGQKSGTTLEKVHRWERRYFRSGLIRTTGGKTYTFSSDEISWVKTGRTRYIPLFLKSNSPLGRTHDKTLFQVERTTKHFLQVEHTSKHFLRSNARPNSFSSRTHDQTISQVEHTTKLSLRSNTRPNYFSGRTRYHSSTRLPPLWPGFDSLLRGFFSGFSGFPPSTKINISKF